MDIRVGTGDVCTITLDRAVAEELALALAIALGGASDSAYGKGRGKGRRTDGKTDGNGGRPDAYGGKSAAYGGKSAAWGGKSAYGGRTDTYMTRPDPNRGKTDVSPHRVPSAPSVGGPAPVTDSRGKTLTTGGRAGWGPSTSRLSSTARPGAAKPLSAVAPAKMSKPAPPPMRGKQKPKSTSRKKR